MFFGCRPLKSFCSLVMEALTECTARQLLVEEEWSALITDERRDHSLPCLPPMSCLDPKSVLCRLLRVQSLGDVDFERLYAAYDDLVARFRDGSLPYDKMRWTHPHMTADWVQSDGQDDIRLVQRYRISSTARDCSIMIAFQRLPDDFKYYIHERPQSVYWNLFFFSFRENDGEAELPRDLSGHRYKCHASVVDLDPKPVACVEKHRRRNAAMYEAFLAQQK